MLSLIAALIWLAAAYISSGCPPKFNYNSIIKYTPFGQFHAHVRTHKLSQFVCKQFSCIIFFC